MSGNNIDLKFEHLGTPLIGGLGRSATWKIL
jgi:hypothetical protein